MGGVCREISENSPEISGMTDNFNMVLYSGKIKFWCTDCTKTTLRPCLRKCNFTQFTRVFPQSFICIHTYIYAVFPCKFISDALPPANQNGQGGSDIINHQSPQIPNQGGVRRVHILTLQIPLGFISLHVWLLKVNQASRFDLQGGASDINLQGNK